jgi:hypothetical protein
VDVARSVAGQAAALLSRAAAADGGGGGGLLAGLGRALGVAPALGVVAAFADGVARSEAAAVLSAHDDAMHRRLAAAFVAGAAADAGVAAPDCALPTAFGGGSHGDGDDWELALPPAARALQAQVADEWQQGRALEALLRAATAAPAPAPAALAAPAPARLAPAHTSLPPLAAAARLLADERLADIRMSALLSAALQADGDDDETETP